MDLSEKRGTKTPLHCCVLQANLCPSLDSHSVSTMEHQGWSLGTLLQSKASTGLRVEGRLWVLYVAALGVLSCSLCPQIPSLGPWPLL